MRVTSRVPAFVLFGMLACRKERLPPEPAKEAAPPPAPTSPPAPDDEEALAQKRQKILDEILARADAGPCRAPLAEDCGAKCPTYDSSWTKASLSDAAKGRCSGGGAETGTCGAFRYVSLGSSVGGRYEYFDRTGKLVGVRVQSDYTAFCGGKNTRIDYGEVPTCTPITERKLCMHDASRRCLCGDPLCTPPDGAPCAQN